MAGVVVRGGRRRAAARRRRARDQSRQRVRAPAVAHASALVGAPSDLTDAADRGDGGDRDHVPRRVGRAPPSCKSSARAPAPAREPTDPRPSCTCVRSTMTSCRSPASTPAPRRPFFELFSIARDPFEEGTAWELAAHGPVTTIGRPGGSDRGARSGGGSSSGRTPGETGSPIASIRGTDRDRDRRHRRPRVGVGGAVGPRSSRQDGVHHAAGARTRAGRRRWQVTRDAIDGGLGRLVVAPVSAQGLFTLHVDAAAGTVGGVPGRTSSTRPVTVRRSRVRSLLPRAANGRPSEPASTRQVQDLHHPDQPCTGHKRIVPSALADATVDPSGDTSTWWTTRSWPSNAARTAACCIPHPAGAVDAPVTTRRLSGVNATDVTESRWPFKLRTSLPLSRSHRRAVPSALAVARTRPLCEKATAVTERVCPRSVRSLRPVEGSHELAGVVGAPGGDALRVRRVGDGGDPTRVALQRQEPPSRRDPTRTPCCPTLPDTALDPSGATATAHTLPVCPANVVRRPPRALQTWTTSLLVLSSSSPPAANATAHTRPPLAVTDSSSLPVATFHNRAVLSLPPARDPLTVDVECDRQHVTLVSGDLRMRHQARHAPPPHLVVDRLVRRDGLTCPRVVGGSCNRICVTSASTSRLRCSGRTIAAFRRDRNRSGAGAFGGRHLRVAVEDRDQQRSLRFGFQHLHAHVVLLVEEAVRVPRRADGDEHAVGIGDHPADRLDEVRPEVHRVHVEEDVVVADDTANWSRKRQYAKFRSSRRR